jgi:flavodoxin I
MKKIGLFYGKELGVKNVDLYNISEAKTGDIEKYDNIIFGTSSWGIGDMQDDWESFIDDIAEIDFSGKKIALFGLGDQKEYPGSYNDGLGTLYCRLPQKDGIIGYWSTKGYKYYFSSAEKDGKFVGLAIDEDTQPEMTAGRVKKWSDQIKKEFL